MIVKELQKFAKPYIIKPLKKLTAMAFARKPPPVTRANYAFMNIALKIDIDGPGWQKVVAKVLNGIHGVSNFKMEDDGMVMISGTVDPKLLLKRLGKTGTRATIRHWQYGECSSNMYVTSYPYGYGGRDYYQGDNNTYSQGYGSYYPQYGANPYEHAAYAGNGYGIAAHGGNDYGYPNYGVDGYGYSGYGRNAHGRPRYGYSSYGVDAHPGFVGGSYGYGDYGGYNGGSRNHYGHYNMH